MGPGPGVRLFSPWDPSSGVERGRTGASCGERWSGWLLFPLQEKADLGELNFSLCYLPTAGRLTVTIIKASNLKAMDLTGFSGVSGLKRVWERRAEAWSPGPEGEGLCSVPWLLCTDPYVKASLISEGRRLKKRKTSIKKNTLNPTYNEALVFDVAPESVENVGLSIAVVDYDW